MLAGRLFFPLPFRMRRKRIFSHSKAVRFLLSLILFGIISFCSYAQNGFYLPEGVSKCKIHFKLVNDLIVLPVELNGIQMSFILDTGSRHTLLFSSDKNNESLFKNARKIKLFGVGMDAYIEGLEAKGIRMRIGKAVNPDMSVYIISSDSFDIVRLLGTDIHGIIGYDFFQNFIVDINYNRRVIRLIRPEKYKIPCSGKYVEVPIRLRSNKPFVQATIQQESGTTLPVNMLIDTGNSDALWLFEDARVKPGKDQKYFEDYLGTGISGQITGKKTRLKRLNLDEFVFSSPTVSYLDSTMTRKVRLDSIRNGSIGAEIWKRFRVVFDYPERKIFLKKNKSFKEEFRYNRAGIHLIYAGKTVVAEQHIKPVAIAADPVSVSDGVNASASSYHFKVEYSYKLEPVYMVYYVRPGSPADSAGILKGDIIVSVNHHPAYRYSLREINNFFYGKDGKKLKITLIRKGKKFSRTLVLSRLF